MLELLLHTILRSVDAIVPKDKNLIVLGSQEGKRYFDNSKYMYEYLLENRKEYTCYWICRSQEGRIPGNVLYIRSFKYLWVMLRAKYVFVCYRMSDIGYFRFSRRTVVVQLWHGAPLKNVLRLVKGTGIYHRLSTSYEISNYNYFIVSSRFEHDRVRECTGLSAAQVLVTGYPRHDALKTNAFEIPALQELKTNGQRVVLLAPTFRDSGKSLFQMLSNEEWSKLLEVLFVRNCVLVVRAHATEFLWNNNHSLYERLQQFSKQHRIVFADNMHYPDAQDFLKLADILISDYSGMLVDYQLLSGSVIRFCPDIEDYKKERGLVEGFDELPLGPICRDCDDLVRQIVDTLDTDGDRSQVVGRIFFHENKGSCSSELIFEHASGF